MKRALLLGLGLVVVLASAARTDENAWRQEMQAAALARRDDKPAEAIKHLVLALKEAEAFPQPDQRLFVTLAALADTYEVSGRIAEAERFYARAISTIDTLGGSDEPAFVELLEHHAAALRKLGRKAEAEKVDARKGEATARLARVDAEDAAGPKFQDRTVRQWTVALGSAGRMAAMEALQAGDPAALPVLVALAKSPQGALRGVAMGGLAELGVAAKDALATLSAGLADHDLNVRYHAATAFRRIGPAGAPAVPALIQALSTHPTTTPGLDGPPRYYKDARAMAAEALGTIGPLAKAALPRLREVAEQDEEPEVRAEASAAIKSIEKK